MCGGKTIPSQYSHRSVEESAQKKQKLVIFVLAEVWLVFRAGKVFRFCDFLLSFEDLFVLYGLRVLVESVEGLVRVPRLMFKGFRMVL
jgi:hypothetical protein